MKNSLKFLFVCLTLMSLSSFAQNATSIEELINRTVEVNTAVKADVNRSAKETDCLPSQKLNVRTVTAAMPKEIGGVQTIKDTAGVDFDMSVLTPEKASQLFKNVKVNDLALRDGNSLCKERSQVISAELEKEGVLSGKAFALPTYFGRLYPNPKDLTGASTGWNYHVANTILVRNGSRVETWVLDPFLFNKPVPLSEWQEKLKSHPDSKYSQTQITNRFVYDPKQIGSAKTKYDPRELMQARARLQGRR